MLRRLRLIRNLSSPSCNLLLLTNWSLADLVLVNNFLELLRPVHLVVLLKNPWLEILILKMVRHAINLHVNSWQWTLWSAFWAPPGPESCHRQSRNVSWSWTSSTCGHGTRDGNLGWSSGARNWQRRNRHLPSFCSRSGHRRSRTCPNCSCWFPAIEVSDCICSGCAWSWLSYGCPPHPLTSRCQHCRQSGRHSSERTQSRCFLHSSETSGPHQVMAYSFS